ncbi:MAG TPA: hypothetical protein VIG53_01560 [Actinomycetota bacterium]
MTDQDHEAIQELLAGYALRSLSGDDAAEAERALDDHLPGCDTCRRTLEAFDAVAADLAFATDPVAPPDLLLARLHRDMEPRRRAARTWNAGRLVAVAASIIVIAGVSGLVLSRSGGVGSAELVAANLEQALTAAAQPDAETREIGATTEVTAPDGFFLFGRDVPQPPVGQVYRLWLIEDGEAYYVDEFVPESGIVALRVLVEGSFDDVLVTLEDAATTPGQPGSPAWQQAAA